MKKAFTIVMFVLVCGVASAAPEAEVRVTSDSVPVGSPFIIEVAVTGGRIESVKFPSVPGMQIAGRPSIQSNEIAIINSNVSTTYVWGFPAQVEQEGEYTIPSVAVRASGEGIVTKPVTFTASRNTAASPRSRSPRRSRDPFSLFPPSRVPGLFQEEASAEDMEDALFVECSVDKTEVFKGEAVTLTMRLWESVDTRVHVLPQPGNEERFPETPGFYALPESPDQVDMGFREKDDHTYRVSEFRQHLYPTTIGELTIGEWTFRYKAYSGMYSQEGAAASEPIIVSVKPLPDSPPNFSGAVGQYRVEADLAANVAAVGESVDLAIRISGNGNPDAIGEPVLPEVRNAQVSAPKWDGNSASRSRTDRVLHYSIVPTNPGKVTIEPIAFCFFDPNKGEYETQTVGPFLLTVNPARGDEDRVLVDSGMRAPAGSVEILGADIRPIVTNPGALGNGGPGAIALGGIAVAPMLAYGCLALIVGRKRRFMSDTAYARERRAFTRARKRLAHAAADPSDELYRALIGYVADKFDASEAGMTSTDAHELLNRSGAPGATVEQYIRIARSCERARYSAASLSAGETRALADAAFSSLNELDAFFRNGRSA